MEEKIKNKINELEILKSKSISYTMEIKIEALILGYYTILEKLIQKS